MPWCNGTSAILQQLWEAVTKNCLDSETLDRLLSEWSRLEHIIRLFSWITFHEELWLILPMKWNLVVYYYIWNEVILIYQHAESSIKYVIQQYLDNCCSHNSSCFSGISTSTNQNLSTGEEDEEALYLALFQSFHDNNNRLQNTKVVKIYPIHLSMNWAIHINMALKLQTPW